MKNAKTKIFITLAALILGLSFFGCIQKKIDEKEDVETTKSAKNAKPEKTTDGESGFLDGVIGILERDGGMSSDEIMEMTDKIEEAIDIIKEILDKYDISDDLRNMSSFQGDGFTLTYSGVWELRTMESYNGGDMALLSYILDGTELLCSGKSSMMGYSFSRKENVEALYEEFYDMTAQIVTADTYISEETDGFETLKDGILYAAFGLREKGEGDLMSKLYVIASEKDNVIVSFVARLGEFAKVGPDIPIMPILRSIEFESKKTPDISSYEQKVIAATDEFVVSGYAMPSLAKVMGDAGISHGYAGQEKTIGKMIVPSIGNFFEEPEKVIVEIIEITYENVENAWNAIDAYGGILYNEYGFLVTYQNFDWGYTYYFSELIKRLDDKKMTVYVAALYSLEERVVKLHFGLIDALVFDGIGSLNLERIAQEGID